MRTMQLARKPVPPIEPTPAPPPEMPRSTQEVDAALVALEAERVELRDVLAGLPARETELLDQDAPDAAFSALDLAKRRAEHALGRLDTKEAQLVRLAERYAAEASQAAYEEVRERYLQASRAVSAAAGLVAERMREVAALSLECDRAGFSPPGLPTLPPVGFSTAGQSVRFDGHLAALGNQAALAEATPKQMPRPAPRQRTYAVRFLKWSEFGRAAYQRGQIANFVGADCEKLVQRGAAEWMRPGMAYDPLTAVWGAGPAPETDNL